MNYKALHEPHFLLRITFSTMCSHCPNNIGLFGSSPMDVRTFFLPVTLTFPSRSWFYSWAADSTLGIFFLATIPCLLKSQMSTTGFWFFHLTNFPLLPGFPTLENGVIIFQISYSITLGNHLWLLSVSHSCWFIPCFYNSCSSFHFYHHYTAWIYHVISPGELQKLSH